MTETVITYRPIDRAPTRGAVDGLLGAVAKGRPEVRFHNDRTDEKGRKLPDGIDLVFGEARPTAEVREKLKAHGFRFSPKQVLWYARDTPEARALVDGLELEEWDIDTNVYEKHSFWALVRSMDEYRGLRGWVEFMVAGSPPAFYNSKKQLEARESPHSLVNSKRLKFKKFWNKLVSDGEEEAGDGDGGEGEPGDGGAEGPSGEPGPGENAKVAERLDKAAAAMQPQIDEKRNPAIARQPWTHRRQGIIDGMRAEAGKLEEIQSALAGLAEAWRWHHIGRYPFLQKVRQRSHVELILEYRRFKENEELPAAILAAIDQNEAKLHQLGIYTRWDWSDALRQLKEAIRDEAPKPDPQAAHGRELEQMIQRARGYDIPGFFPTPDQLVDRMIQVADIGPGDRVFDPSAGIGSILDKVAAMRGGDKSRLEASEINQSLRDILEKKGYLLIGRDFMEQNREPDETFRPARILMNPPFEDGQDVEHVARALGFLKPGGRLVAVMSEGTFQRSYNRDKVFRQMLRDRSAWVSGPIHNAFKGGFKPTDVSVRLVAISQDGGRPLVGGREIGDLLNGSYWGEPGDQGGGKPSPTDDDMAMLELEAQAELELMLMEEEERKAKGRLNGPDGIDHGKLRAMRQMAWAINDKGRMLDLH